MRTLNTTREKIKQHEQKDAWKGLPTPTVVAEAREQVYGPIAQQFKDRPEILGPLEEVVNRLDASFRAVAGTGALATSASGSSQQQ